jgi:hypothetical protein
MEKYSRHEETRTPDLYRVNPPLLGSKGFTTTARATQHIFSRLGIRRLWIGMRFASTLNEYVLLEAMQKTIKGFSTNLPDGHRGVAIDLKRAFDWPSIYFVNKLPILYCPNHEIW